MCHIVEAYMCEEEKKNYQQYPISECNVQNEYECNHTNRHVFKCLKNLQDFRNFGDTEVSYVIQQIVLR